MHIPAIATSEMEVLSFAEAMRQSGREAGYDTARWLYVPDFYTEYRYVLGTITWIIPSNRWSASRGATASIASSCLMCTPSGPPVRRIWQGCGMNGCTVPIWRPSSIC